MEVANSVDVHPVAREKIAKVVEERGVVDYTSTFEPGVIKGDNYSGTITKAKIEGLDANGTKTTFNWIVKCASTNDALRTMAKVDAFYKRELYVYEKILPTFAAFQAEKQTLDPFDEFPALVATVDEPPNETLIMEDMKSVGYVMRDRKLTFDVHHVRLAVKAYAKFHAVSYALKSQRLDEFERIAVASKERLLTDPGFKVLTGGLVDGINQLILGTFDQKKDAHIVEKFKKYSEKVYEIVNEVISMTERSPYCVVTHGDCWVNNLLFHYGNEDRPEIPTKICILDWQNARIGSPAFDLSYFLFTCTDKAFRDLHYHSMTKLYYYTLCTNLIDLGSDPEKCLPYDVFQNELKRYSILGVNISMLVLNMMLSDVDEIPDSMLENIENLENYKTRNEGTYKERVRGVIVDAVDYGYFDFLQ